MRLAIPWQSELTWHMGPRAQARPYWGASPLALARPSGAAELEARTGGHQRKDEDPKSRFIVLFCMLELEPTPPTPE